MQLDSEARVELAAAILAQLRASVPGSEALLRGSLAGEHADQFSDIDVLWDVPDARFQTSVEQLPQILARVRPVAALRWDPDIQRSARRRLAFVRFAGVPLFWRLDLDILAQSLGRNEQYDRHNPAARGSSWSLTESALANAVAAVKAQLRRRDDEARQLLARAYGRIGLDTPDLPLPALILRLADEVVAQDATAAPLAAAVRELVREAV